MTIVIPDPPGTPDALEIEVMRKQTRNYIRANSSQITLKRKTKVPDGAGGHTYTDTPLPPQTMRVIQQNLSEAVERRNVAGEVVRPTVVVMAEWNADMRKGDTFPWEGMTAEIVWVTNLNYELLGEVSVR